ncbi:MAG: DUF111 family protein, partial [Promethearchaeota archaeon]
LGVRYYTTDRICVDRELGTCTVELNGLDYDIRYKLSYYLIGNDKKIVNIKPEYDDLRKLRQQTGFSIKYLTQLLQAELNSLIKKNKK